MFWHPKPIHLAIRYNFGMFGTHRILFDMQLYIWTLNWFTGYLFSKIPMINWCIQTKNVQPKNENIVEDKIKTNNNLVNSKPTMNKFNQNDNLKWLVLGQFKGGESDFVSR